MSRSPPVVRRLARVNVAATVVITLVVTGLILPAGIRHQVDVRLQRALPPGFDRMVTVWIEQTPKRYERRQVYRDRQEHRLAACDASESRQALERRLRLLGDLHQVRLTWFPRPPPSSPALAATLRQHGLAGSWNATTLSGEVRGGDTAALPVICRLTVNETGLRGEAIVLAHPVAHDGLLVVALADRTSLAGILDH